MVDLSISIVNTSNWEYLEPCLKSIINTVQKSSYEILVVDNASDDGSVENVKREFPNVILSVNESRYGFARNNNTNLCKSSGRYVVLLNDDTLVLENSLDNAVEYLDRTPEVGVVGCKMIDPDGTVQYASGRQLCTLLNTLWTETGLSRVFRNNRLFASYTIGDWSHDTIREIGLPQESGMIVRREVVDEVGLLDERFFMFGEGPDWCRRIKRAGWKIMFLPNCPIVHFGGVTNRKSSVKMSVQHYKSMYLYFRKESAIRGFCYRFLIIMIYVAKSGVVYVKHLMYGTQDKSYSELLTYYRALIDMMIFRLVDPNYPFPSS